jgi:hypothetical protein
MPFDWKEYLALAQHLQQQSTSEFSQEAALRCAVSRAYYAAFCHARNYARDHQKYVLTNKPDEHARLRQHYQKRGDVALASALELLRQWRNQCDYNDNVSNLSLMIVGAVSGAQKIFDTLR